MASRKDYEAIAAILRREHEKVIDGTNDERGAHLCLTILTNKIMGYFQNDNPKFDWDRFAIASRVLNVYPELGPAARGKSAILNEQKCACEECKNPVTEETFTELDGLCEECTNSYI
jgi:hypothetical protein